MEERIAHKIFVTRAR